MILVLKFVNGKINTRRKFNEKKKQKLLQR